MVKYTPQQLLVRRLLKIGSYIKGRIGGDQKVADRWAKYDSDNSYHPAKGEKASGSPKEQASNKSRYTARDTNCNCGPIGVYPGSKDDRDGFDLVLTLVNQLGQDTERQAKCLAAQNSLSARIEEYQPKAIVALLKSIKKIVAAAAAEAGDAKFHAVSFPGFGQQGNFQREMALIIRHLPRFEQGVVVPSG